MALWERLDELESQILAAVPPVDAEPLHWLSSDAGPSYCYECARKARAAEMGLDAPPEEPRRFDAQWKDDWEGFHAAEEAYRDFDSEIDGGFDGCGSDTPESCETCGCTLRHTLTDYGVDEEIAGFLDNPPETIDPETSYALTRIFLNLTQPWAEENDLGRLKSAIQIAEHAVSVLLKVPA